MPFPTNLPNVNGNGVAICNALEAVYDAIVAGSGAGGATAANQVTYGNLAHADAIVIESYIQTTNDTLDQANLYLAELIVNIGYQDSISVTAWLKTIKDYLFSNTYGASAAELLYQIFGSVYGIHNDTSSYLPYLPNLAALKNDQGTGPDGVNFDVVVTAAIANVATDLQGWVAANNTKRVVAHSTCYSLADGYVTTIKYRS